ncbi:MAG: SDR family oxidoreductase [Gammaproteobacteria bacterium]|nr:SDR family oxidoreductase [Gammaproteobacteria bacterium]
MKILITGNMGYVGPCLIDRLRGSYPGARLIGFDMGYFAHCLTGAVCLPEHGLDAQYFGDVRKLPLELFADVYAVVHLAAISNDPMGNTFEEVTSAINQTGSVRLATLAKQAGVRRFVFASSCSMYGAAAGGPRSEGDALNPLTAYARSKAGTEQGIRELADSSFIVTSLRFATACGMSHRLRLDLVLNDFVAGAFAGKEVNILSDGTPWRPLIHVSDMARAIDWAISRDATNGGAFLAVNAGSDEWNYQVSQLAEAVAKAIPGTRVSLNKNAAPDKRSYQVNFGLYRKLAPRYQPQVDLAAAIHELKDGLAAMRFQDIDFRGSPLIRLKVLSGLIEQGALNQQLEWQRASAA